MLTPELSFDSITYYYDGSSHKCLHSFTLLCLGSIDRYRNFSSAQAGRRLIFWQSLGLHITLKWLCVRNKLTVWKRGSISWSHGSLFLEPYGTIDIFTILFSLTSCQLTWRTEVYFKFLPVILLSRGLRFLSDLLSLYQFI